MNYKEQAKAATKSGAAEKLSTVWVEWTKKGQELIGKLVGVTEIEGKSFKGTIKKLTFLTDEGPAATNIGNASFNEVGALMEVGEVYVITYKGDEPSDKGSDRHVFEVQHIPTDVGTVF